MKIKENGRLFQGIESHPRSKGGTQAEVDGGNVGIKECEFFWGMIVSAFIRNYLPSRATPLGDDLKNFDNPGTIEKEAFPPSCSCNLQSSGKSAKSLRSLMPSI